VYFFQPLNDLLVTAPGKVEIQPFHCWLDNAIGKLRGDEFSEFDFDLDPELAIESDLKFFAQAGATFFVSLVLFERVMGVNNNDWSADSIRPKEEEQHVKLPI